VFAEILRVLKPGGRLGISDVVADPSLTDAERAALL
jgi:predicted methyltransferase